MSVEAWKEKLTQKEMDAAKDAFISASSVRNGVAAAVEAVLEMRARKAVNPAPASQGGPQA